MKKKLKILLAQPIHESGVSLLLEKGYEVRISPDASPSTLMREITDASGLLVRLTEIPESVIEAAGLLQVIARHGVGYDRIDVAAATRRKIPVCITPHANAQSVAEHTLALMLTAAKRILLYDQAVRSGDWEFRNGCPASDLNGKVLGIIGMGRIGTLVCRMASAGFGMKVHVFSPRQSREKIEASGGTQVSSLSEILKDADFVSLHVPLTPETRTMITETELRMMKPTAFLINTARGSIVDEAALARNLKDGTIAGAGVDVFDPEPPRVGHPFFDLPNIVLSPHSAALTAECIMRMARDASQSIIDVLEGRRPDGAVNPEIWQ
jgi:D-3-phosphoglycerate dehydrogenase